MKFDIIGKKYWWFLFSALLVIPGLLSIIFQGFNLGIDFTGGTMLDLRFAQPVSVTQVRDTLKDYHLEQSTIQLALAGNEEKSQSVLIRTRVLEESERRDVLAGMSQKIGQFDILRVEKVGAVVGSELARQAALALIISWLLMIAYITYRFEFKFAIAGIIALIHDVIIVLGVFSIFKLEIDASFIAAMLTIIGYSIHDTIVIFDRIRENLKTHKKTEPWKDMVNRSIYQTMTRSIYTVLTVLFTTVALYFFGGETTKNFSLALIIGFTSGAYSSIFNASPLWDVFKEWSERKRLEARTKGTK